MISPGCCRAEWADEPCAKPSGTFLLHANCCAIFDLDCVDIVLRTRTGGEEGILWERRPSNESLDLIIVVMSLWISMTLVGQQLVSEGWSCAGAGRWEPGWAFSTVLHEREWPEAAVSDVSCAVFHE